MSSRICFHKEQSPKLTMPAGAVRAFEPRAVGHLRAHLRWLPIRCRPPRVLRLLCLLLLLLQGCSLRPAEALPPDLRAPFQGQLPPLPRPAQPCGQASRPRQELTTAGTTAPAVYYSARGAQDRNITATGRSVGGQAAGIARHVRQKIGSRGSLETILGTLGRAPKCAPEVPLRR